MLRLVSFGVAAALCVPSIALAEPRRVATVAVSDAAHASDAELGAHALTVVLQADARFEWVNAAAQVRDDAPRREARSLDARQLFTEAREALDNLAVPKALTTLEKCVRFYEESDLSTGIQGLLDALALKAIAQLSKNDKAGFTNEAQCVLAFSVDYAWDPGRLTPVAQALLEPLKKKVKAAPPSTLDVTSTPSGAWAYVDGVFRGMTPVSVGGLAPGGHIVTLSAVGYELTQEKVFTSQGRAPTFALKATRNGKELLGDVAALRAALEGGDTGAPGGALARFLTADEVLVAGLVPAGGTLTAVVLRVAADGTVIGEERRAWATGFDWAALAHTVLAKEAPVAKVSERVPGSAVDVQQSSNNSGVRRAIGWVGAAVAVVSLCAGIGLGVSANGKAASANMLPQVDTQGYSAAASSARLQAGFADGGFALAVVAAAVSIFMLATGYSEESAEDTNAWYVPSAHGPMRVSWGALR